VILIDRPDPPSLPDSWREFIANRTTAMAPLTDSKKRDYVRNNDGWGLLKDWLSNLSFGKCWYCESKSARAPMDVDHFRPKLLVTVDGVKVTTHKGYWWLAYDWMNFRLSCQRCNRPFTTSFDLVAGKRNEFPLRDETTRAHGPVDDVSLEQPRLLDPCQLEDVSLLAHCLDGNVQPKADEGTWEWARADYTITQLGLADGRLAEDKRGSWQSWSLLLGCFGNQAPPAEILDGFRRLLDERTEFSAYLTAALRTHRDKTWIESLL